MKKILTIPNPILKQISKPVASFGSETQKLIDEMIQILEQEEHGAGLAAPQVGELKRIILITQFQEDQRELIPLINPKITFFSKDKEEEEEGCLSVPNKVGVVERSKKIKVNAQNRKGKKVKIKAAGFFAREIQHEVDHLNGILFTDRTPPDKLFDYLNIDGKWVIQKEKQTPLKVHL